MQYAAESRNRSETCSGMAAAFRANPTRSRTKGDRHLLRTELEALEAKQTKVREELSRCVDAVVKVNVGVLGPELRQRAELLRTEKDHRERAADPGVSDTEKIIALLRQRGLTSPREIGAAMNMSRASIYRHMAILESAGQVAVTGNTRSVKYAVA